MNSDRTVYAPEMDEGGNGVVRVPSQRVKIVRKFITIDILLPFNSFLFFHSFIHSFPPKYTHIHTQMRIQMFATFQN